MKRTIFTVILLASALVFALAFTGCSGSAEAVSDAVNISAAPAKLTYSTFFGGPLIEFAAQKFEETHEGVTIEIVPFVIEGRQDRRPEEYALAINTAIMSGGGEDIIDMANVPWEKLADKDKLVDLNQYLTLNPEEIRMNILDAFLYDGRRYVVPLSFNFDAFRLIDAYRDSEPAENFDLTRLSSLAEKYTGARLIISSGGINAAYLAETVFTQNFKNYVDLPAKKVNVDNADFISILKDIKKLHDSGAVQRPEEGQEGVLKHTFVFTPVICGDGTMDYSDFFLFVNEEGNGAFDVFSAKPAINANSKNQALAGEFIDFLLSEEIQSSPENAFTPVNIEASAISARQSYAGIVADGYGVEGFDVEKNIEVFNTLAAKLTAVSSDDNVINNFLYEEFKSFFDGEQTAEQAAANLQNKLTMYLNE